MGVNFKKVHGGCYTRGTCVFGGNQTPIPGPSPMHEGREKTALQWAERLPLHQLWRG